MNPFRRVFEVVDPFIAGWMARHGVGLLRVSLGVVFLWFGALKFFPGLSPAEALAGRTVQALSGGLVSPAQSLPALAALECAIGLGLITGWATRFVLFLLFFQMAGALTPLFLFPHETFIRCPLIPTLEGQYIIKNLVLISAGIVVGGTVRGGGLKA
jgi:uncharacterized membrane protein YphA (DoxX/SURF4 family)